MQNTTRCDFPFMQFLVTLQRKMAEKKEKTTKRAIVTKKGNGAEVVGALGGNK